MYSRDYNIGLSNLVLRCKKVKSAGEFISDDAQWAQRKDCMRA